MTASKRTTHIPAPVTTDLVEADPTMVVRVLMLAAVIGAVSILLFVGFLIGRATA